MLSPSIPNILRLKLPPACPREGSRWGTDHKCKYKHKDKDKFKYNHLLSCTNYL